MQLENDQIAEFDERGYLFFPGLLDEDEVAALQSETPALLNGQGPEIIREKDDAAAARLVFGGHVNSEAFRRLSLLPCLLNPSRQLLRDEVYIHQSRMNPKQGFGQGASWDWHQDYSAWQVVDGMPEPRCIMAAVFIDDCTVAKSPLLVVPGTHRHGLVGDIQLHRDAKGYSLYHMDHYTLECLANEKGMEALVGPAGSVCFASCNLVHGSANNVSPWRRAIMYLIYNAVSNACTSTERDWFHNNRDFTPLQPLADDSLKALA